MSGLLGGFCPLLEASLHFRSARETVLAGNIANADTPHYRRRDIRFDALLAQSISAPERTNSRHLPAAGGAEGEYSVEVGPPGTRPDGNGVDLDRELLEAHRNAGAFADQAQVLARLSNLMRTAIGNGG